MWCKLCLCHLKNSIVSLFLTNLTSPLSDYLMLHTWKYWTHRDINHLNIHAVVTRQPVVMARPDREGTAAGASSGWFAEQVPDAVS